MLVFKLIESKLELHTMCCNKRQVTCACQVAICVPLPYISINKLKMCFNEMDICLCLWEN